MGIHNSDRPASERAPPERPGADRGAADRPGPAELAKAAVFVTDRDNRIIKVNSVFASVTGYGAEQALGQSPRLFKADRHDDVFYRGLWQSLNESGHWHGQLWNRRAGGDDYLAELTVTAIAGDDGTILQYVAALRDVTAQYLEGEAKRRQQATHDELTGLPNRELFDDRLAHELITARRAKKGVALLIIGLDRFKLINDALGRDAGDVLLREVANRLTHCVRESDTAARLDADLFAVVTPVTALDDSVVVAEKVLKIFHTPLDVDGGEVAMTASIGIAVYPADGDHGEDLVAAAAKALQHAKNLSPGGYQFFAREMNDRAKRRLELEAKLRKALERSEFLLYYQPKVAVDRREVVGMEALVRWRDPERGLVPPGEFIPVAEETGLIGPIGEWVLREACRQNAYWQSEGLRPVRVAVNVSGVQFRSRDLIAKVSKILEETSLDPKWLELEITESMLMENLDAMVQKLKELRELGIHLSIDDFGTGYSSLSYLSRFPIDTLKIDRSFVKDVETDSDTAEIARAIIGLSHSLRLEVVAEGAETLAHVKFLETQGCDMIQGYYFSRPLPAEEFEKLLRGTLVLDNLLRTPA